MSNAKKNRAARRRNIARAIDCQWESLRSHLADAVKCRGHGDNEEWHARAACDYAFTINVLSKELHELAKVDFKVTTMAKKDRI